MSFQPVTIGTGLVGWQFLKSTETTQRDVFSKAPQQTRDIDYFTANISKIKSADALVSDRRLLTVALGAYGLQDDIDSKYFIKRVLEDGLSNPDALANRLADDRYKALARAFAFDSPLGPRTTLSGFAKEITAKYKAQSFEIAVGRQDETLRLALNFERGLPEIATGTGSGDAQWFRVMGTPPLRKVFETALALPKSFGQLDIDKQLVTFREKMQARFNVSEVAEIADPDIMKRVIQTYLLQTQVNQSLAIGTSQVALSMLQAIPRRSLLSAD